MSWIWGRKKSEAAWKEKEWKKKIERMDVMDRKTGIEMTSFPVWNRKKMT